MRNSYTSPPKKSRTIQSAKTTKTLTSTAKSKTTVGRLGDGQMNSIIENIKNKYSKDVINEMSQEQLQNEVYAHIQKKSEPAEDPEPIIEDAKPTVIEDEEEESVIEPQQTAQT